LISHPLWVFFSSVGDGDLWLKDDGGIGISQVLKYSPATGGGKTPEGLELSFPTAIAKNGGSAAGKSVTISDELELFRAQLGNRLTSHGITVPYSNLPQVIAADAAAAAPNHESGSSLALRLGRLNAAAGTVVPPGSWAKARVPPVIPSLVDVGPVNLTQVGLSCNINNALQQFVTSPGSSGKRLTEQQQLHIVPIMDLGGLDMTTMGVQCGPREPRATPGLAIKRKSKLPVPRDCTSLGRGQVMNELNIYFFYQTVLVERNFVSFCLFVSRFS
jgi:hypothetical protein